MHPCTVARFLGTSTVPGTKVRLPADEGMYGGFSEGILCSTAGGMVEMQGEMLLEFDGDCENTPWLHRIRLFSDGTPERPVFFCPGVGLKILHAPGNGPATEIPAAVRTLLLHGGSATIEEVDDRQVPGPLRRIAAFGISATHSSGENTFTVKAGYGDSIVRGMNMIMGLASGGTVHIVGGSDGSGNGGSVIIVPYAMSVGSNTKIVGTSGPPPSIVMVGPCLIAADSPVHVQLEGIHVHVLSSAGMMDYFSSGPPRAPPLTTGGVMGGKLFCLCRGGNFCPHC